jgi:hypothetical protein
MKKIEEILRKLESEQDHLTFSAEGDMDTMKAMLFDIVKMAGRELESLNKEVGTSIRRAPSFSFLKSKMEQLEETRIRWEDKQNRLRDSYRQSDFIKDE